MTAPGDQIGVRLGDPSPEVRRRAVRQIPRLGAGEGAALLLRALGDGDWRVRKEAVTVLGDLDGADALAPDLLAAIEQSENVGLRNAAAEALALPRVRGMDLVVSRIGALDGTSRKIALEIVGRSGDPRRVALLVAHLDHPDVNLRAAAAEQLGECGGRAAVEALSARLGSGEPMLVLAALQALNRLGARIPFDLLEPLAMAPIFSAELLEALGRTGDPAAAHMILGRVPADPSAIRALTRLHDGPKAAAAAVEGALGVAPADVLDALAALATRGDAPLRRAAVQCLLWSRRAEHVALLVQIAQDEALHPLVIEGLGAWGPKVIDELDGMLPKVHGRMLASVVGVFGRLLDDDGGRARATLFSAYLSSGDLVVATAAAGALARFGDAGVVPRLVELAGADPERVRRAAAHALARIGERHPEEVRAALLGIDLESERGVELMRVFQVVGRREDASALAAAMSSPRPALRRAALGALAAVAGPDALGTISLAMTDENADVRMATVAALSRIGAAAAETIVSAIHTAEELLRPALVRALGRVAHPEAAEILRGVARESAELAIAALEAVESLGLDLGELKGELLAHPDSEVVKKALVFLDASLGDAELVALLDAAAWDVRLAAVERLARRIGRGAAAEGIRAALAREEDDLVRAAMERALAAHGGKR